MYLLKQILLLGLLVAITACSSKTKVTGIIFSDMGKPLYGVNITLGFSPDLQAKTQTRLNGEFLIILEETCFVICAGGDPKLSLSKSGYRSITNYVPRFQISKRKYHLKPFFLK